MAENMSKETILSMHKRNVRSLEIAKKRIHDLEERLNTTVGTVEAYKVKEKQWATQRMANQQMFQQTMNALNIQSSKEKEQLIQTYNDKIKKLKAYYGD